MLNRSSHAKLTRREIRDLNLETEFFEGLERRGYRESSLPTALNENYSRLGQLKKSATQIRKLIALDPKNPRLFYDLACCYTLELAKGQKSQHQLSKHKEAALLSLARTSLLKALNLGFKDFKWMLKDPDLTPLRKSPGFKAVWVKISSMQDM